MSEYTSPVTMAFEFQRNAIEGTHEAVQNSVQMQQNVGTTVVEGFAPARDVSKRSTDLARTGVEAYFDAVESVAPAGSGLTEARQTIHEAIDTVEESQLEAIDQFETAFESGAESGEEFLEEFLAALDEQVATLLENHEDLEAQTVEALEGIEEGLEELREEFEARGEELQEQLESQAEAVQEQLEDVTEGAQDAADASA